MDTGHSRVVLPPIYNRTKQNENTDSGQTSLYAPQYKLTKENT